MTYKIKDLPYNEVSINSHFYKPVTFEDDVQIGVVNGGKYLRVNHYTFFNNTTSFNVATGSFVLNENSYIPDSVLKRTDVIKDLEKLAEALRKDYFYEHFYEWVKL